MTVLLESRSCYSLLLAMLHSCVFMASWVAVGRRGQFQCLEGPFLLVKEGYVPFPRRCTTHGAHMVLAFRAGLPFRLVHREEYLHPRAGFPTAWGWRKETCYLPGILCEWCLVSLGLLRPRLWNADWQTGICRSEARVCPLPCVNVYTLVLITFSGFIIWQDKGEQL